MALEIALTSVLSEFAQAIVNDCDNHYSGQIRTLWPSEKEEVYEFLAREVERLTEEEQTLRKVDPTLAVEEYVGEGTICHVLLCLAELKEIPLDQELPNSRLYRVDTGWRGLQKLTWASPEQIKVNRQRQRDIQRVEQARQEARRWVDKKLENLRRYLIRYEAPAELKGSLRFLLESSHFGIIEAVASLQLLGLPMSTFDQVD